MKLAAIQSNYIPWKGYFDIINDADIFVFYDDVQYTHSDWRNRNYVKTRRGKQWLIVPVHRSTSKTIDEIEIAGRYWQRKHLRTLHDLYRRAPHFSAFSELLHYIYIEKEWLKLSELNHSIIQVIAREVLGSRCRFVDARTIGLNDQTKPKQETSRVDRICRMMEFAGADTLISGPAVLNYATELEFAQRGYRLEIKDYSGYPQYPQFHPPFDHHVTILDLLFHLGPDAPEYIWGWRD